MFSVQRKASLQEAMTGDISDTRRREVEGELAEVERRIQEVIKKQERYQKDIDQNKQILQRTSREQDEGEEGVLCWVWDEFGHRGNGTCYECTHKIIMVSMSFLVCWYEGGSRNVTLCRASFRDGICHSLNLHVT